MSRATQRKGDIATTRAIASFTDMGFDVSLPVTESAAYDVVVDDGEKLHRVQCKFTGNGYVDLRNIHSNARGYVVKRIDADAYDWLYAFAPPDGEFLLKNCPVGRHGFRTSTLPPLRS